MIVKDGTTGLARCLRSVGGVVDRITIGDTGSTDDIHGIAAQFRANLIPVPWHQDFAEARNFVLAHAACDWILFLDADEMLDPSALREIPELLRDPAASAYDITAWNYVTDTGFRSSGEQARSNPALLPETRGYPAYFPSTNTRLFRRQSGIYFEHCVHETVADRLSALGLKRKAAKFVIHHFGYVEDSRAKRSQKETLYYDLALKKVAQSSGNYQANLGAGIAELDHAKNAAGALLYFIKAMELDSRGASAWLYAGICLSRLGRHTDALAHLNRSLAIDAANVLTWSSLGDLYLQSNDHTRAHHAYARAIGQGDASSLTLAKLGATEVHLGYGENGIAKVELAMSRDPDAIALYDIYAPVAFLAGKPKAACEAADHRLSLENVTAFHFLLAATLHLHSNMKEKAERLLHAAASCYPNDVDIRNMMTSLNLIEV